MTVRSVLLGLLGAVLICGCAFFNDRILKQTFLVGNNMPVSVYGALILFVLFLNPLMKRWALRGRELAVILAITLAACCIPAAGLLRCFTSSLILPHKYNQEKDGWRDQKVLELAPKQMLADISQNEDEVLTGFVQGMGKGDEHMPFGKIPWYGWTRTLLFWLPLILTIWAALVALSVVLHRQWSQHEHLPYPIATFTNALLPEKGRAGSGLFHSRLFWIGMLGVLIIHLNNFTHEWFPDYVIQVTRQIDLTALSPLVPTFIKGGGWSLLKPTIFFCVIGIVYFVPTDASLSFGLGPYVWAVIVGTFAGYGMDLNGAVEGTDAYTALTPRAFVLFGANVGVLVAILYTGRHYYSAVMRRSLGLPVKGGADRTGVWACRVFLVLMVLFVVQLVLVGLDWQLAVLYSAVAVLFFVVMARIIAETGLFYMQPYFFPCLVLWGLFGVGALGAKSLLIMQLVTMVLLIDPRETLMPFMTNSLKLLELRNVKLGRTASLCVLALILGLCIGLPITLYIQYDQGSTIWEGWAERSVPLMPFNNAVAVKHKLVAQGALESAEARSGWNRFGALAPNRTCMWAMGAGLGLVLLFAAARLRFTWWPLHPLMFVVWSTYPMQNFCGSFLLGWLAKILITKYGGSRLYNRLKPLMIGLIAGEVLGAIFPSIIGAVYYFVTGDMPKRFQILPG